MSTVINFKPRYKNSLEEKVIRLKNLDREIKKLSKIHLELKKEIIDQMKDDKEIYDSQGHVIATYTEQSRKIFNKEKFEAFYPGQYEKFVFENFNKVFRLK